MKDTAMTSHDVVVDERSSEYHRPSDSAAVQSDARTLAAIKHRITLDESAVRRRFRQNVAVAVIFALAALTLLVIVRLGHASW